MVLQLSGIKEKRETLQCVWEDPANKLALWRENDGFRYTWSMGKTSGYRYWFLLNDVAVAYAKVIHESGTNHKLRLSDIEVRPGFRGRGWSSRLLKAIGKAEGGQVHSTGGYTPEGFERLKGRLPLVPGYNPELCYRSQSFVKNWDELTVIYG